MSKHSKKKRWSRRKRKMMKMGRLEKQIPQERSVIAESPKLQNDSAKDNADLAVAKEKPELQAIDSGTDPEEAKALQEKSAEITSHLKTVFGASLVCLLLLGFLYFLEIKKHWVENVNAKIKSTVSEIM